MNTLMHSLWGQTFDSGVHCRLALHVKENKMSCLSGHWSGSYKRANEAWLAHNQAVSSAALGSTFRDTSRLV